MRAMLRDVDNQGVHYQALTFWCPGCERIDADGERHAGLHMLPVNTTLTSPSWEFDGSLEAPTLTPSILTRLDDAGAPFVCHSYLRGGRFEFLTDCTHAYAGQTVELPHLPDWAVATVTT